MLDKKTLYVIYLVYKVNELCLGNFKPKKTKRKSLGTLGQIRLKGYLYSNGQGLHNLDDSSLINLLLDMRHVVDSLPLSREEKSEIPRNLHQFNSSFKKWLDNIHSNQLQ